MTAPVAVGPAHAAVLASVHALADPAPWTAAAFAAILCAPGAFALLLPPAAGFALLRVAADESELLLIAVVPARRRAGNGRALLDAAIDAAAARGARAMFLEVASGNRPACRLYDGAGFVPVGRRSGYYADGRDAVLMRKALTSPPSRSGAA